ncbi:trinucleotide repeat-containing gene 6B protein isoform X3 [Cyprinodon tularosa]|uniref:trinucleotide repeat-containing gene 6B protein isoform X3 n=1 Tax=Cyprinodon tularosa TaxID=77115 RepID=UPI0018E2290D|nr:trinucleotide repeat-containing gene 6B protein isoform X3 [Cyprinodon tularosa]
MEDKKRKKEEKRKREASQKVAEQKNKVTDVTKPAAAQSPATQSSSASPSPGPIPATASPSPATSDPGGAATPSQGGNNAKRLAVANGQPASNTSSSSTAGGLGAAGNGSTGSGGGTQAPQQPSRYMPREVPPRFRCQQDHKVLLKRGQPPLSSMLLGGGGGGGDGPNPNMAAVSDSASSLALTSSIAASTSNYANSMWGTSSGGQASSQGKEKVIVDGNDLEEWPSIAGSDGGNGGNSGMPVNSISASGNQPSLTSSFSLPNECMQLSNSAAWGTTASQGQLGGGAAVAAAGPLLQQPSSLSKAPAVHGSHDASGPVDGSSGIPGANFSPNANPSAWPALVQQDSPAASGEGALTAFHHQVSEGSANNSASMGLGGGAVGVLGGHPSISVNPSSAHQHQLHQMQSRDREAGGGKWDSESAGPKISGGEGIGGGMDHGVGGGRVGVGDPNVATSWRGQPSYSAAYSKTGVSRTDGWEGGESGKLGAAEGDKGTSGWGYPSSTCGSAENGGNCGQTSGATQGGWGLSVVGADRGASGSGWGGSSAGIGGSNPAPDEMGNCSSNSSSSGGSTVGNPPTASSSLTAAAANRAWDNQKGEGEVGEWGDGARGRGGSSSSGGNSRSGSMTNSNRIRRQAPNAEAALQNLLSRSDLDPRVLSNSGWGQTQIRQNTSWDVEEQEGPNKAVPPSASSKHPAALGGPTQYSSGPRTLSTDSKGPGVSPSLIPPTGSSGESWESSSSNTSSSGASLSGRAPPPTSSNMRHLGVSQSGPVTSSAPGLASGIMPGTQAKATGWVGGGNGAGDNLDSKEWGNEEWRSNSQAEKGGGWGDVGQKGDSSGGGWGDGHHEKGAGSWKDMGGSDEGSGWGSKSKVGAGKNWLEQESKSSSGGGWGDERRNGGHSGGDSGGGGWGNWDSSAPRRTWGTGGGGGGGGGMDGVGGIGPKPHQGWSGGNKMHQMPNSQSGSVSGPQAQLQQQQSQPRNQNPQLQQALDQGVMQGGGGRKLASQAQTQNQSSGWTSGPLPCAPGGGGGPEPSGWEEPSPQSISRKSEIDDGTSAWGDPTHYNYKPVNLWDKNSGSASQQPHGQSQAQQQQQQQGAPVQQQPSRQAAALTEPSGWSSTSPASPSVDNGTAAWGKPNEAPTGWGDPDDTGGKTGSWGNASNSIRSASKSMQDGWGDKESSMAASRHSSWEDEEEGSSMWNSTGSQGSGSSWGQGSNGGWAQSNPVKKTSSKGPLKAGGDSWMSPINRQFSNMGILNDDSSGPNIDLPSGSIQEKKMEAEKRGIGLNDFNGDMRKGGRGGGPSGGGIYRPPGSKDPAQLDAGSYYDKTLHLISQDGCLGEEAPYSLYSPPTAYKPHTLFNHSVPFRQGSHSIFGNAGGMSQSRHQPSVPPMNQSPGMRAQVPHQFLSPQVPGSMLKPMPPPSGSVGGVGGMGGVAGVGGGVFAPQLSPQHLAMLSSIYPPQIQLQLACQLLLQQQQQQPPQQQQILQNQRKFTPNVRQQNDPQQLARIMAVLQQQRQHQQIGGLGSGPKLSPSHHSGMGPKLPGSETLPHPGLGGSVAELQQKAFGPYSGFGSAVNLPGLEHGASMMGGPGGMKDLGAQQSRFKWMMEGNCSPDTSSPDNLYHKNGPVTPIKMPGSSPYSQFDIVGGDGPSDNWHRTPGNKMGAKTTNTPSWPPEFQPGVPWKGIDRVDPESDPYMTPGSMMGNAVSPGLNDSEHQLLQDNTGIALNDSTPPLNTLLPSPGAWPYSASDILNNAHNSAKYTEYKTSWPPEPPGHKSWKASRGSSQAQLSRPPPGLASQKQASPSPWSGGAPRSAGRGWGSGSSNTGSAWSDGSSRESCWLVLSNLTPQIDGSTLRTICMQHGPLLTFHLGLTQGTALIRYCSKQEAAKAQSALHMCVLGNTTILAEFVSEEEVGRYIAHSQAGSEGNAAASAGLGPTAASAVGTGSNGGSCERGGAGGLSGGGVEGASPAGVATSSSSGWQSLDSTGSSSDPSAAQGPALGIFTQWSSNGSGVGGAGAMEAGRQGLWGGIGGMSGAGYPSGGSSLWGSPALEDRHQMGSLAALLPGDLLGGGADSI